MATVVNVAVRALKSPRSQEQNERHGSRRRARMQGAVVVRDNKFKVAGRPIPDVVVHLAGFGVTMLARVLIRRTKRSMQRY